MLREPDSVRQTGRTARQMAEAPYGALFIVHAECFVPYAKKLADRLGRNDLVIRPIGALDRNGNHLRGLRFPAILMDHEAGRVATPDHREAFRYISDTCVHSNNQA